MKILKNLAALFTLSTVAFCISVTHAFADLPESSIQSNDTLVALSTVRQATDSKNLGLLMNGFKCENVNVHIASIRALRSFDDFAQRIAISSILKQDSLWERSFVEGEASTIKSVFAAEVKQSASRFTSVAPGTNLFDKAQRQIISANISK